MRKQVWAPALLLGVGIVLGSLALAQPPADKTIAGLIDKLGSGDFEDREQAELELDKLGLRAIDALKQAAKSEDAEVRRRAEELVAKIEKREASGLILKPTRVTLSLKDAPVAEAVAALAKQSDFAIHLHDPDGKAKDVTVTLELKDTPFWAALDALCEKAGLAESNVAQLGAVGGVGRPIRIRPGVKAIPVPLPAPIDPVPPDQPAPAKPVPPKPEEGFAVGEDAAAPPPAQELPAAPPVPALPPVQVVPGGQVIIRGQGIIIGGAPGMPFPGASPAPPGLIVLSPAKVEKLPADLATSFRVRAMPSQGQFQFPGQTVHTVMLQVTPEPRFQYAGNDKVVLTKAIDDQDQKLAEFDPNQPFAVPGGGVGMAVAPGFAGFGGGVFGGGNTLPIYLKAGEKAAKSLKELSGTIPARIHVPHSKPLVVEKLLDAAGKTVKGEKGGEVKVVAVQKAGDTVTVRFELVTPKDAVGGGDDPGNVFPVPGFQFGGVVPALPVPVPLPAPQPQIEKAPLPPEQPEGFASDAQEKLIPLPPPPVAAPVAGPVQVQVQAAPAIAQIQIGGPGMVVGFGGLPAGLRVLDEKGNPVAIQGVQQQWNAGPNGPAQVVWQVQIAQGKDQPKLDKLTWQLQKAASIDVPFTLKNVPLN